MLQNILSDWLITGLDDVSNASKDSVEKITDLIKYSLKKRLEDFVKQIEADNMHWEMFKTQRDEAINSLDRALTKK